MAKTKFKKSRGKISQGKEKGGTAMLINIVIALWQYKLQES